MTGVGVVVCAAVAALAPAPAAGEVEPPVRTLQAQLQGPEEADFYLEDSSGNWAAPKCVGDGRSGPRVQPVFVYRKGHQNRFRAFELQLHRSLAQSTGIYERSSGTLRTIRWVHDDSCRPRIRVVAVPGRVSHLLVPLQRWLRANARGFDRRDRVYSVWVDSTTGADWSGLGGNRWSATWSSSWGFVWADTHELTHALGAVSSQAPHTTGKGHTWDGNDLMSYPDHGPSWRRAKPCPGEVNNYRLDCGDDDYFALHPKRGSWLARHPQANLARSEFLQPVPANPLPDAPAEPLGVVLDGTVLSWQAEPAVRYDIGLEYRSGRVRWVAMDSAAGSQQLPPLGRGVTPFVRAVNEAGYSGRVAPP